MESNPPPSPPSMVRCTAVCSTIKCKRNIRKLISYGLLQCRTWKEPGTIMTKKQGESSFLSIQVNSGLPILQQDPSLRSFSQVPAFFTSHTAIGNCF